MPRFEIGEKLVGVHFVSDHKSLHGYRPAMVFDQVEPHFINFYELEVVSAHKVGLGPSAPIRPYEGFVLMSISTKLRWHNQYPYATGTPPSNLHDQMFTRDLGDLKGPAYLEALEAENTRPYRCENVLSYLEQLYYLISKGQSNDSEVAALVRFAQRLEKELFIATSHRVTRTQRVNGKNKEIPHHFQFTLDPSH